MNTHERKIASDFWGVERGLVPEEPLKIARRFNAGIEFRDAQVPKRRLNHNTNSYVSSCYQRVFGTILSVMSGICSDSSTVPSGLARSRTVPGVETPGYCQEVPPGLAHALLALAAFVFSLSRFPLSAFR